MPHPPLNRRLRAAALAPAALVAAVAATPAAGPLEAEAWSSRPVLVFVGADDSQSAAQLAAFDAERAALRERDMPVFEVSDEAVFRDGAPTPLSPAALRTAYGVAPGSFAVVLIGKDTGVKHRADAPVDPNDLFRLVDAMPMRRDEMRRGE